MCDFEDPPQYIALAQLHYALLGKKPVRNKELLMDRLVAQGLDVNYALPADAAVAQYSPDLVGSTALHFAVKAQDLEVIAYILQRGAKVTVTDHHAFSPIRLAIGCFEHSLKRKGILKHPAVESLLKAQHEQNDTSNPSCKQGLSHLHIACMVNDARMLEFLLRSGAPVDAAISADSPHLAGFRPVHVAARYCAEESLKLLLSHGAEVRAREARGLTPLQLMIKYNQQLADLPDGKLSEHNLAYERLMKLMLDHCGTGPLQDEHGLEWLHVAASMRDSAMLVDVLNENPEIDVNAAISGNSPYWPGYTPLHFAARCGVDAIKILAERGADLAKPDASGIAPFDLCLNRYEPKALSEIMSLDETLKSITFTSSPLATLCEAVEALQSTEDLDRFLSKMSNVDDSVSSNSPLWSGYTLLHLAVTLMYPETYVSYLGKLRDEFDLDGEIQTNTYEVLEHLLSLQANPIAEDAREDVRNFTPVHLAFRQGKHGVLNYLLDHLSSSPKAPEYDNATDVDGLSLLHISSVAGKREVVDYLLKKNADVDVRTKSGLTISFESQELYFSPGSTPLHYAVTSDSTIIQYLIDKGADPLTVNSDGLSPLLLAFMGMSKTNCARNGIEILLWKIRPLLKFDPVSTKRLTHFHVACWSGSTTAVEAFLDRVDINEKINCDSINTHAECPRASRVSLESEMLTHYAGYTPLHIAVESGSFDVVRLLVVRGADIHARNARGLSPLHMALASDDFRAKHVLAKLMWGVNDGRIIVPERGPVDDYGVTALHIACRKLDVEWVKRLLLDKGNDVNAQISMHSPFWAGNTPLHAIPSPKDYTYSSDTEVAVAKLLIAHGADLAIPNAKNVMPLHVIFLVSLFRLEIRMPSINLENKLKNYCINRVNKQGLSFLHIAVMTNNVEMVRMLCTQGADVNRRVDYFSNVDGGQASLHFAAIFGKPEMVQLLIEKGAKVNTKDSRGWTPLHFFCEKSERRVENLIPMLCEYGADVNAQDAYGRTPLEILLESPFEQNRVISLMSCGARLNTVNPLSGNSLFCMALSERKQYLPEILSNANVLGDVLSVMDDGSTALHNIVRGQVEESSVSVEYYYGVIDTLLTRGCYINARDNRGRTALHVAVEHDNYRGVCSLLAAGINANIADNAGNVPLSLKSKDEKIHLALLMYLHKLTLLGLEVSEPNRRLYEAAKEQGFPSQDANYLQMKLLQEIDALAESKLHENLSLREVMTERAISEYPTMPRARRDVIVQELASSELYGTFPTMRGPIRYQYRRILERIDLDEPAKHDLGFIMGNFGVPDLCIEKIVSYLNNEDLKAVIAVQKSAKRKAGNDECAMKKVKSQSPGVLVLD